MLVPRGYSSPYFEEKEITTFLKALNKCFKDYGINNNKEKKERVVEYIAKCFKKDIEQLLEYRDSTSQEDFQKVLLKEYYYTNLDQLLYTTSYLEKYIKDFKSLEESSHMTQVQIHDYYREFYEIKTKYKESNNITKKALTFKFLYTLPQNLKIKAMRFTIKGAKFDLDDIKSFKEIYMNIENSCTVLRDIDELVQEQGIGELPTRFKSLDLDYTIGSMPTDKASSPLVLLLIRAIATDPSLTRITDQEINKITDRLNKLYILKLVIE